MISTASPPPLRIPPNRQDTPPAEPAKKFKSLRLALYGSNPGYPTGTGSSVNLRVGLAGTKDKRRQRTAQQVSSTRGRSARPMKISGGNMPAVHRRADVIVGIRKKCRRFRPTGPPSPITITGGNNQ